jgi:hypothetical protein
MSSEFNPLAIPEPIHYTPPPPAAPAAPSPAAPQPAAAPVTAPAMPMSVSEAKAAIQQRINDAAFYERLKLQDPAAHREWARLHQIAHPVPPVVRTAADVDSQVAARAARFWDEHIASLKAQFPLSPAQEEEIRGGVIAKDVHEWAKSEKAMLLKDRAWYQKFKNGDRAAKLQWGLLVQMLSLRPI